MMHEPHTIAATPPPTGRSILSSPPTYDGIGADEYIEWESKIDNIFAQCHMCEWRKINNAFSVLRHLTSIWWESLSSSDKPHTWNDMKILMRETFINLSLVINSYDEEHQLDHSPIIPPTVPNLLQDNAQKSGDDMTENEVLPVSCENSTCVTSAGSESKGNANDANLTKDS
jgi:hypothetical protein